MILKNAWYKYDRIWVIGDIRLARNPDFRISGGNRKGSFHYEGLDGADEYMQSEFAGDFEKDVFHILDENIKNGTEVLTHLELAVQYCMRLGMFDDEYRKNRINDFIEEIKTCTAEKDGVRYHETLAIIGGDPDNISADGMEFVERKTYERLVEEHIVPKHILPDEKAHACREFYRNLRFVATNLILVEGIFEEI